MREKQKLESLTNNKDDIDDYRDDKDISIVSNFNSGADYISKEL